MPTDRELEQMVILIHRTPNDPHEYVDYTRKADWLERLPLPGLVELHELLSTLQKEVGSEIGRRDSASSGQEPLSTHDQVLIDAAWEKHKAARPTTSA